ncbi:unnamed protein product [Clonostachys rosea f. rosea IK726]|jgi:hypothetical protein|uniref:Uncharacterized protein n=1 Tax=Clonostachys rosea f. rosea IK726 TaxID=1349383 RepID=A0ACA9TR18_BIOOC|nr:unnamed protein product [Clonostachys rosea f. rosea IK726]
MTTTDMVKAHPRLMNSSMSLTQFQLDVRHVPGKMNVLSDALSRLPTREEDETNEDVSELDEVRSNCWFASHIMGISEETKAKFAQGYKSDKRIKRVIATLEEREDGEYMTDMRAKSNRIKGLECFRTSP